MVATNVKCGFGDKNGDRLLFLLNSKISIILQKRTLSEDLV